jgi:8-oxo-dGTP pyrophosphatase MutT (NUDIX family)
MKKRGFGVGKWNGFGGKIEAGETIVEAAIRELKEESDLDVAQENIKQVGYLVFNMMESKKIMRVHVFETWEFEGQEKESEEMRPQWYKEDELPFQSMWKDDPYWMPTLLKGKSFTGR